MVKQYKFKHPLLLMDEHFSKNNDMDVFIIKLLV